MITLHLLSYVCDQWLVIWYKTRLVTRIRVRLAVADVVFDIEGKLHATVNRRNVLWSVKEWISRKHHISPSHHHFDRANSRVLLIRIVQGLRSGSSNDQNTIVTLTSFFIIRRYPQGKYHFWTKLYFGRPFKCNAEVTVTPINRQRLGNREILLVVLFIFQSTFTSLLVVLRFTLQQQSNNKLRKKSKKTRQGIWQSLNP